MSRGRDYKAEYARRIARATERGKTRQEARGHRAHEHVHRAEREREEYGISSANLRSLTRWWERNMSEARVSAGWPDLEALQDYARENGYDAFRKYASVWTAVRSNYVRKLAGKTYERRSTDYLDELMNDAEAPEAEWMYYH